MRFVALIFCGLAVASFSGGCTLIWDSHTRKAEMVDAWQRGDYVLAKQELSSHRGGRQEKLMWALESGSLHALSGDVEQEKRDWDEAALLLADFDERAVISVRDAAGEGAGAITNANAIEFRGWTRDRILLNANRALWYLRQGDLDGALVEIRRLRSEQEAAMGRYEAEIAGEEKKLQSDREKVMAQFGSVDSLSDQINANPEFQVRMAAVAEAARQDYGNFINPYAVFLSGLGCLLERDYNNARVDFERLYRILPESELIRSLYVAVLRRNGDQIPEALAGQKPYAGTLHDQVVYVIFANGRGPALKEFRMDLVVPYLGYTGFALPVMGFYAAPYAQLEVKTAQGSFPTEKIASLDAVMSAEYQARLPLLISRTLINFLVKESASLALTLAAQEAARQNDDNDWMVLAAYAGTGLYKYATNTADTRSWEMQPKEVQVAVVPLPENRQMELILSPGGAVRRVQLRPETRFAVICVTAQSAGVEDVKVMEFSRLLN